MSKKIIWTIVIVLIIIAGIWYFMSSSSSSKQTPQPVSDNTGQIQNVAAAQVGVQSSASTDTSNAGINQDVSAIDAQMQGLGTDSASANQNVSATSAQ